MSKAPRQGRVTPSTPTIRGKRANVSVSRFSHCEEDFLLGHVYMPNRYGKLACMTWSSTSCSRARLDWVSIFDSIPEMLETASRSPVKTVELLMQLIKFSA